MAVMIAIIASRFTPMEASITAINRIARQFVGGIARHVALIVAARS
ncbi:hypothetical protein [Dyella sp. OK004]|nr:hypothetical protein [Dyella sp. OK004]